MPLLVPYSFQIASFCVWPSKKPCLQCHAVKLAQLCYLLFKIKLAAHFSAYLYAHTSTPYKKAM